MLNHYSHPLLDITNSTLLVLGIVLMSMGAFETVLARETAPTAAQGSFVNQTHLDSVSVTLQPSTFHASAVAPTVDMSLQLILGMVLVLLGCGFHAMLLVQKETYNSPKKGKGKKKSQSKQWHEVFLVKLRK